MWYKLSGVVDVSGHLLKGRGQRCSNIVTAGKRSKVSRWLPSYQKIGFCLRRSMDAMLHSPVEEFCRWNVHQFYNVFVPDKTVVILRHGGVVGTVGPDRQTQNSVILSLYSWLWIFHAKNILDWNSLLQCHASILWIFAKKISSLCTIWKFLTKNLHILLTLQVSWGSICCWGHGTRSMWPVAGSWSPAHLGTSKGRCGRGSGASRRGRTDGDWNEIRSEALWDGGKKE